MDTIVVEPSILEDPLVTEDDDFKNVRAKFRTWNDSELLSCASVLCVSEMCLYLLTYTHTHTYACTHVRACARAHTHTYLMM